MPPAQLAATRPKKEHKLVYQTDLGQLYQGDCLPFLASLPDSSVDMVFADPPFNLGKNYGKGITDQLKADEYLEWSRKWLSEAVRVLKDGGAIFVFNLPRWLIDYGAFLAGCGLQFRHWIAMRMPKAYPRGQRLSPAHYGCLYYTKGPPRVFNRIYVPIPVCRHCGGEIRDYGGHRKALNDKGLNLMDVVDSPEDAWVEVERSRAEERLWADAEDLWDDIPPVRHGKHKNRGANELAPILIERLIALSTNRGDLVLDPFGGSGTTYYAAEKLGRRWLGIELGDTGAAVKRLQNLEAGADAEWESARGNGHPGALLRQQVPLFPPTES
jgi:site-specific DNA-methyltransferase (adenine-specific)